MKPIWFGVEEVGCFQLSVYVNNHHMDEDDRIQISVTNDKHLYSFTLIIDNVSLADAGILTFVASNGSGSSTTTVELVVLQQGTALILHLVPCMEPYVLARFPSKARKIRSKKSVFIYSLWFSVELTIVFSCCV